MQTTLRMQLEKQFGKVVAPVNPLSARDLITHEI